jgi:hypothetical protein
MSNVFNENVTFNSSANFFDTVNVFGKLEVIRDITVSGNSDVIGNVTAASFIKSGGISDQFLKADGSVDSTTYLTAATVGGTPDNVGGQLVVRNGIGGFSAGIVTATTFVGNGTIPIGGIIMWSGSIVSIPTGWALCNGSNGTPNLVDRFIVGAGSGYGVAATGGSADAVVVSHTHGITDPGHRHRQVFQRNQVDKDVGGRVGDNGQFGDTLIFGTMEVSTTGITINSAGESATNANLPPYYALAFIMRTS